MKKLLYFLPLSLIFACGAMRVNADIGMSKKEFEKANMAEEVIQMNETYTVYLIPESEFRAKYVYFKNDKLIRMDEGQYLNEISFLMNEENP